MSRAVPLIQSILFFLNSISMPPVRPDTILSLRACTAGMSMPTAAPSMPVRPHSLAALRDLQRVRVFEQRLGGNAAPDQAGAAERLLLLDHRDLEAQLRGANGGHVPAGARANHYDVVLVSQRLCSLSSLGYSHGHRHGPSSRLNDRQRHDRLLIGRTSAAPNGLLGFRRAVGAAGSTCALQLAVVELAVPSTSR